MENKKDIGIVLAAIMIASIFAMIAPTAVAEGAESEADKMLSKIDARNLVISQVLNGGTEGKLVYVSSEPVKAGTVVESWFSSIELPQKEGWFFFVDDDPWANWAHPCRYVFVDLTGNTAVYKATTPPNNLMELEVMVGLKAGKKPETYTNPHPLKSMQTASNPAAENCYAVIISGGFDTTNNYWRYWNDSSFIYTTLTQVYGYADDHIYVLISDGTDPSIDRHCYNATHEWYDSSPLDLDGDGDDDIDYAATRANITTVFDTLSGILSEDDYLFIFTTNHGSNDTVTPGATPQDVMLLLWGEYILDDEFATELNKISADCEAIMIMMEQCFSGGFVDDLIPGPQDRVIATACSSTESSWAMPPDYYYDEFSYYWTCAVAWQDPAGVPVDADSNSDGQVSMEEAFDYAEAHDTRPEIPQYSEDPAGIGSDISLSSCRTVQQAIDDGIAWLVAQQNPDGSWGTSDTVGRTGLAVKKLEHHAVDCKYGYCLDSPFDPAYPYADNVSRGLDYIFANAHTIPIGMQPAGDPDTNGNGTGVYFGDHRNYETGIALMAIAESTTPDRKVDVPGSLVDGWTYYDVAVDTMNYIAFGQTDSGYGRGGWDYTEMDNSGPRSDNSVSGWVVLGLQYAETEDPLQGFNIAIPQFVKNELNIWIDYIQNDVDGDTDEGGSGYTAPDEWVNILKTGNLLKQMAFVGDTRDTQRVQNANEYICRHWMDVNDDPGWRPNNYHAMYSTMKGFVSLDIHETCGHDWQADYEDAIVAQQNDDGSWSGCEWGDPILCTEWALLTLQKAAPPPRPTPPPAAVPAITPIGMIALIGLLSVIAAIGIRTSIRKKRR